jgi:hypothetical protein
MRAIRLLVDPKRSLLLLLITGLLVWGLQSGGIPGLTYLGFGLVLFPALLLVMAASGGILPVMLSALLMLFGALRVYGIDGLWLSLYLLPPVAAFLACLEIRLPFFKMAGIVLAASILSIITLFVIFQYRSGGDLYGSLAGSALKGLEGMPGRDSFLYSLWRAGFISHSQEAGAQVFQTLGDGWTFKPEILAEFIKQLRSRIISLTSSLMPGLLTTFTISLSALGTGFAITLGLMRASCPDLGMPPFSRWHLPRTVGRRMWVLAAGYLLAAFSNSMVLQVAGQMMYNVFFALFAIQGLAIVDFKLKARGRKPAIRLILLLLLYFLLSPAALLIGIFDQSIDSRKLRPASPSPEEP